MSVSRNTGSPSRTYAARPGQTAYGIPIGILMLKCRIPFIPGDVGNASTYEFPVHYVEVPGATTEAVVREHDPSVVTALVDCAQYLVRQGVRAITSDCGFFGVHQEAVADAVPVPVFLSSLMQVPLIRRMLGAERDLGIVIATDKRLDEELLARLGLAGIPGLVFRALDDKPHFHEVIFDEAAELDPVQMEREVVEAVVEMRDAHPRLGAILLECSDLPPYSAAVHRATGLPVFDFVGFINYVHQAVAPRPYEGSF